MPVSVNTVGIWLRERLALRIEGPVFVDPKVRSATPGGLVDTSTPSIACLEIESTTAGIDVRLGKTESAQYWERQPGEYILTGPMSVKRLFGAPENQATLSPLTLRVPRLIPLPTVSVYRLI